jgi:hypothetical protein
MTAWFCEAHRLTTTTDCPKCDDEQIADLERAYPPARVTCHKCGRGLHDGDTAWASDWIVIDGCRQTRAEVRYTCDDCEAAA